MISLPETVRTLSHLRDWVRQVLCSRENLIAEQFQMSEQKLLRAGQPCGVQFCLHGPRSVRLAAVWAADRNQVYFYDAKGERFGKVGLPERLGD